jgi:AcrR family transcriptional regulator
MLTERILDAAIEIYIELGWAGFNFDVVSRRAQVGKGPLYARWSKREDLIIDAFRRQARPALPFNGTLRENLIILGRRIVEFHVDGVTSGVLWARLRSDTAMFGGVFKEIDKEIIQRHLGKFRKIITSAINAGELPRGESARLLLDVYVGGLINHVIYTPASERETIKRDRDRIVDRFANWVLAAAGAAKPGATKAVPKATEPRRPRPTRRSTGSVAKRLGPDRAG